MVYLASVVNLGMIWCFGFFFLESLDDLGWGVQQRDDALASRDDVQKLGSNPTLPKKRGFTEFKGYLDIGLSHKSGCSSSVQFCIVPLRISIFFEANIRNNSVLVASVGIAQHLLFWERISQNSFFHAPGESPSQHVPSFFRMSPSFRWLFLGSVVATSQVPPADGR